MKVVILWNMSDFPAYGILFGMMTIGRLACPYCMEHTKAFRLAHNKGPIQHPKLIRSDLITPFTFNMSGTCGNCDCADKSQCVRKGNRDGIETELSYDDAMIMNVAENDGCQCCGPSCACTSCGCCTH